MPTVIAPTIEVLLGPDQLAATMRADVHAGLTATPKELPPTWLYDARGCELFEQITTVPEYYPTRAESGILRRHSAKIASMSAADTFIELGSGTSEKTRLLLAALAAAGTLQHYMPFDVAEPTLREAAEIIVDMHPAIRVTGIVGDFRQHLDVLPDGGRRLIAFLGSTIGNLRPAERGQLLAGLAAAMQPGDGLLLGIDLVKDPARLVAAYDDVAGVTAAFNLNILTRINQELGADFKIDRFRHTARFDHRNQGIEMRLRSLTDQQVTIADLGITVDFRHGEEMRTEISAKFRPDGVRSELVAAGLRPAGWWTDPAGDYALSLSLR